MKRMIDNKKADGTESTRTPGYKKQAYLSRSVESANNSNALQAILDVSHVIAEGLNHYSRILRDLVYEVPSSDHPPIYLLLMQYAEALDHNHPGTKDVAAAIKRMFDICEVCISVPNPGEKEDAE